MPDNNKTPVVFISYSRTSEAYIQKIVQFAISLQENGIHVKLDAWDLKPGNDISYFQEQMVTDPDVDKEGNFNQQFADDFDKSVDDFLPYRHELIDVFTQLAKYKYTEAIAEQIHAFFESFYPLVNVPMNNPSYEKDNYKFILQELFLCCIAVFLKYKRFNVVTYLTTQKYFVVFEKHSRNRMTYGFNVFRFYLDILDDRAKYDNAVSLQLGEMLKKRCEDNLLTLEDLMQADFILYVRQCVGRYTDEYLYADAGNTGNNYAHFSWYPATLIFLGWRSHSFELFQRAENADFLAKLLPVLGVTSLKQLKELLEQFDHRDLIIRLGRIHDVNVRKTLNLDRLGAN